jgi:hypothetical protein
MGITSAFFFAFSIDVTTFFLPAEIMQLPDLTAIVRFKTYDPLITRFQYKNYPDKAEGFVLREDLLLTTNNLDDQSEDAGEDIAVAMP